MIQSRRGLIAAGVITFLIGLIVLFPARAAVRWFAPPGLAISGVDGTIWNGAASELLVEGIYLKDVMWRAKPLRLLTGQLAARVSAEPVAGAFDSDVSTGLGGSIRLSNLNARLPLDSFSTIVGMRGLQGRANLQFERIEIRDGLPVAADGLLEVNNLVVPLIGRDNLGGYKAEFNSQDKGVAASIEDTDGVVDLAGSLEIRPDRSFLFSSQVVAKPETPSSLRQQLRFLPPANDRGQQEMRLEGSL